MNNSVPTTEQITAQVYEKLPISKHLNTQIKSIAGGLYSCGVPLDERTENHFGTVHAAVQWCCVELLGGLIWLSHFSEEPHFFVVCSSKIDFLLPARSAIHVEAEFSDAEIKKLKKSLIDTGEASFTLQSIVMRSDEKIVAKAECSYLLRKWREPGAGRQK